MKNILSSLIKEFIKVVIIVAIAVPTIALFAAWTGPTKAPPDGNADAPVNVGAIDQIKTYETDGLGNLISGKSGGLGVGTFFSRFGTLLATDGGNVGIGMGEDGEIPQAKLHVDGDAIFEGNIQVKGGLPEKDKVLMAVDNTGLAAWGNVTTDMLIPQGYKEVYFNAGEDVYGEWRRVNRGGGDRDTCGGDAIDISTETETGIYTCGVDENKICGNIKGQGIIIGDVPRAIVETGFRTVECRAAKILRKNAWQYAEHNYTGRAVITNIDHDGDHEYCWVDVNFSNSDEGYSCSRSGVQSPNLNEISFSKCKNWLLGAIKTGAVCSFPFPPNKISSFSGSWDMKTDKDYGEGWVANGSGALDLNFTEIK